MQKLEYIFRLNNEEIIHFIVDEHSPNDLCYDSWSMIFFIGNKVKKVIGYDMLYEKFSSLCFSLTKTLNNELVLDKHTIPDIGFLANEINYKKIVLQETVAENFSRYSMWQCMPTRGNTETWLYNNKKGQIILFMAPRYPFFYARRPKKHLPYPEWIKTYQPFAKRIIPKEVAQQWLKQAEEIMERIADNSEKNEHSINVVKPKNGQKALDNSIAFKQTTSARVSIADDEFVVLTKKKDTAHHGHVLPWDDLECAMQDALIDAKLATDNGKILCKN